MTVSLTYDDIFSRVRISVTGVSALATIVRIERSTNQVNWTAVRGGQSLTPVGNAVSLDDYEFSANVLNYYRARAFYTSTPLFLGVGTAAHGNNTSVVPGLPAGTTEGDTLLIMAAFRARGSGEPAIPGGYDMVADASNVRFFAKKAVAGEVAPTVAFGASVANATTSAQIARFRGLSTTAVVPINYQDNSSAQNVNYAGSAVDIDDEAAAFAWGWKQDDWISVTQLGGFTEIFDTSSTLGDDQGMVADWQVINAMTTVINAGTFVVTGGANATSTGGVFALGRDDQLITTESSSITPMIDAVWLKDIYRPFLNRTLGCIPNQSSIRRQARNGIFPIVNRSYPVAVTDLRGSREYTIEVITQTTQERLDFDLIMSTGDIFFIQAPPDDPTPTVYAAIQDTDERRPLRNRTCGNDWRVFSLPIIEVAQPALDVVGVIGTWQTVINTYVTWADVLVAHSTWASLLTLVGSVDEVLVP